MKDPREEAYALIRRFRAKMDQEVLKTAENHARFKLGLPLQPNRASEAFMKAKADGGVRRAEVLAELERYFAEQKRRGRTS